MMKVFQGRDQKKNNWIMASDGTEVSFSPAELAPAAGVMNAIRPLAEKAYHKQQAQRLLTAYKHYSFAVGSARTVPATAVSDRGLAN